MCISSCMRPDHLHEIVVYECCSEESPLSVTAAVQGFPVGSVGKCCLFNRREYFYSRKGVGVKMWDILRKL